MFCVLYRFKVKSGKVAEFKRSWIAMTELLHDHAHSLGSRLHKKNELEYIAYAQWPDRHTFENATDQTPVEAENVRKLMRESCEEIEVLMKLEAEIDLLKN